MELGGDVDSRALAHGAQGPFGLVELGSSVEPVRAGDVGSDAVQPLRRVQPERRWIP